MRKVLFSLLLGCALASVACQQTKVPQRRLPETLCLQLVPDMIPEADTLVVFDNMKNAVTFRTDLSYMYKTLYTTKNWTGERPTYSVYFAEKNPEIMEGGLINAYLTDEQKAGGSSQHELLAGKVTEVNGNFYLPLKDSRSFLNIRMDVDIIALVKVESVGGEMLAGDFTIKIDSLAADGKNFWKAVDGGRSYPCINFTPEGSALKDGCFVPGSYYLALLPQNYAKGIQVTMYDKDGKTVFKRVLGKETGFNAQRNETYLVEYEEFDPKPDTVVLKLDFYNSENINPFGFGQPGPGKQNPTEGETYYFDYKYEYEGQTCTEQMPFVLCKGTTSGAEYKYFAPGSMTYGEVGRKILNFTQTYWWMKLPAIKGRYLKSVTVSHGNAYTKRTFICTSPYINSTTRGRICSYTSNSPTAIATSDHLNTETMSFPNDLEFAEVHETQLNTAYYLCGPTANAIRIYHLEITYTRNL